MDPRAGNDDDDLTGHAPLAGGIGGDRCTNCGTPLASDQRYCINCGQRRGRARFSFESLAAASASTAPQATTPAPEKHPRATAGMTLIAFVGTLLIAIGVGFLIGHNNTKQIQQPAQAAQVIKIQGGGGGGGSGGAAVKGHRNKASKTAAPAKAFTAPTLKLTAKTVQKVNQAASGVLGSGAGKLPSNPTVQPGQACTGGAGCQGGHFTGNFFGGG